MIPPVTGYTSALTQQQLALRAGRDRLPTISRSSARGATIRSRITRPQGLYRQEANAVERTGTLRYQFVAGILAWPAAQDVINDAKSHDLDVEVHMSGWLVKRGWIVARGPESGIRRMMARLRQLEVELSQNQDGDQ